jgi:hypothetical protein
VQGGQAAPPAGLIEGKRSYTLVGEARESCEVAAPRLTELRNSLAVTLAGGTGMRAGDINTISWTVSAQGGRAPTYLVIAADAPIRTNGSGFYVLTPDAIAPFRIQQSKAQTRIVIPLHIKETARKGSLDIRPLQAGTLHLSAAIIGVAQCGELADDAPKSISLTVSAGTPEIVVSNRFELRKPDQSVLSPNGTRRIDIIGPRWRLIDVASGSQLSEQVGEEPRFSPTGRFVVARAEEKLTLFDAIDGAALHTVGATSYDPGGTTAGDIAWDDHDSFLVIGKTGAGLVGLDFPLKETDPSIVLGGGCRACPGATTTAIKIDLENNVVLGDGESFLLTGYPENKSFNELISSNKTVNYTLPKRWDFIDGLKFTKLLDYSGDPKLDVALRRFLIAPLVSGEATEHEAVAQDPMVVATRGIGRAEIGEPVRRSKFEERLRDFGLELNEGVALSPANRGSLLQPTGKEGISQFSKDSAIILDETFNGLGTGVEPGKTDVRKDGTTLVGVGDIEINQVSMSGFTITLFKGLGNRAAANVEEVLFLHDSRNPGKIVDVPYFLDIWGEGESKFSGALFFRRYLVLWSKDNLDALVYDLEAHKFLATPIHLPSPDVMERLSLSHDLKTLTKIDSDGGFQIIDLSRGYKTEKMAEADEVSRPDAIVLLSGRVVDDEVVIQAPTGQFDATPEGASYVSLKLPGRPGTYTLSQFSSLLHKAGLLKTALAGDALPAVAIDKFPPAISVKSTSSPQRISAVVDIREEAASSLRIYQDGQFTDEIAVSDGTKTVPIDVARLPGARWIAIVAKGTSGLYSQAATFDAGQVEGTRRRVHLISVGVDRYDDPGINQLELAASDARRFYKAIEAKSGTSVEIVSHALLTDARASRDTILADLKSAIDTAQPGDTVLLFVAGHGIQTPDKQYYLATTQTRLSDIGGTALRWSDLAAVLAKSRSRIAVFLDSCHSGSAGTGFFATSDTTTSALIDNVPSGIVIFSAAKGRELSEESPSSGGGVFTDALVKAMASKATDLNGNGAIEASELYAGVKGAVIKATDGRQTPWFARNDMVGDFVPF